MSAMVAMAAPRAGSFVVGGRAEPLPYGPSVTVKATAPTGEGIGAVWAQCVKAGSRRAASPPPNPPPAPPSHPPLADRRALRYISPPLCRRGLGATERKAVATMSKTTRATLALDKAA